MTGNRDIHLVAGETRDGDRWVVLGVTSIGALLAALTSGMLVIALPEILRDLHTDLFTLLWIVVGYTLASTVLLLVSSAMDPSVLLSIFSGTQVGADGLDMAPFISALHIAFGVGVVASLAGAVVSASRGGQREFDDAAIDRRVAA